MARGWESKSVEDQQQAAEERLAQKNRVKLSKEQAIVDRKRDSLLLQRTRVLHDMQASSNERHRTTLKQGLDFLEAELAVLGWSE